MEIYSKYANYDTTYDFLECWIGQRNDLLYGSSSNAQKALPVISEEFPQLKQLYDVLKETVRDGSIKLFLAFQDSVLHCLRVEFVRPCEEHVILYLFFEWSTDIRVRVRKIPRLENDAMTEYLNLPQSVHGRYTKHIYGHLERYNLRGYVKDFIDKNHHFTENGFFAKPAEFYELTHLNKAQFRCCTMRHPLIISEYGSGKTEATCAFLRNYCHSGTSLIICPKTAVESWASNPFLSGIEITKICNQKDCENFSKMYQQWGCYQNNVPYIIIVSFNSLNDDIVQNLLAPHSMQCVVLDHATHLRENKMRLIGTLHYRKLIFLTAYYNATTLLREQLLPFMELLCDEVPYGSRELLEDIVSHGSFISTNLNVNIKYPDPDTMKELKVSPWKYLPKIFREKIVKQQDIPDAIASWPQTSFLTRQLQEPMDCPVCFEPSNVLLNCGHSMCVDCCSEIECRKVVRCPMCKVDSGNFIVLENEYYERITAHLNSLSGRWIVVSSKDRYAHYRTRGDKMAVSFTGSSYDYSRAVQKFRKNENVILFLKAPQLNDLDQLLLGVQFHVDCQILFLDYFHKYQSFCDRIKSCLPPSSQLICH